MSILLMLAKIFFVVVTVLMIGAILLQEGKGGGLAALGGTRAETAFGASNPIRRMTVVLSVLFFFLCGFISFAQMPETDTLDDLPTAAPEETQTGNEGSGTQFPDLLKTFETEEKKADGEKDSDKALTPSDNKDKPSSAKAAQPTKETENAPAAPEKKAGGDSPQTQN